MGNQPVADKIQEDPVQPQVHDQEKGLLRLFENDVDVLLLGGGTILVRAGPYHADGKVDGSGDCQEHQLHPQCLALVDHDQGDSVGDDLGE